VIPKDFVKICEVYGSVPSKILNQIRSSIATATFQPGSPAGCCPVQDGLLKSHEFSRVEAQFFMVKIASFDS